MVGVDSFLDLVGRLAGVENDLDRLDISLSMTDIFFGLFGSGE